MTNFQFLHKLITDKPRARRIPGNNFMITEPNLIIQGFDCKCIGIEPNRPNGSSGYKKYRTRYPGNEILYLVPVADAKGTVYYNVYQPQDLAQY